MIVAHRKPFEEILKMLEGKRKVLVVGCGGCVTVCLTGGDKEAEALATQLRLRCKADAVAQHRTLTRQCDNEFLDELKDAVGEYDAILSMACGAGVQLLADRYIERVAVLPAMDTTFLGANYAPGVWAENCRGCGQCFLAITGGVCPVTRCAKSLINGPCGGTKDGKCEVDPDTDCGWYLIFQRLKKLGRLDLMKGVREPINWRRSSAGTLRRLVREEMTKSPQQTATTTQS